jgi:hypothetical protein
MDSDWAQLSKYAARKGYWTVSKQFVDGCTLYAIWFKEEKPAKAYLNDFDECKEWINDHESV